VKRGSIRHPAFAGVVMVLLFAILLTRLGDFYGGWRWKERRVPQVTGRRRAHSLCGATHRLRIRLSPAHIDDSSNGLERHGFHRRHMSVSESRLNT
jgi:hypothetical protein